MPTLMEIERKCSRAASTLDVPNVDEIRLLRTARVLIAMRFELQRVVQSYLVTKGRTYQVVQIQTILKRMEVHLRCVLLDDAALTLDEVRQHLQESIEDALDALDLLED